MMIHPFKNVAWATPLGALILSLVVWCGCSRDSGDAERELRHPKVQTVVHYGLTLDREATPNQVAFVLLRAIRDDYLATTDMDRQRALDAQFDVCAADQIEKLNPTGLTRDEYIHEVVYRWTPTLALYVHGLETEWEKAQPRFLGGQLLSAQASRTDAEQHQVFLQLNDPNGDPNARVVLVIGLVRDSGYWRVLRLGFERNHRVLKTRSSAGDSGDDASTGPGD